MPSHSGLTGSQHIPQEVQVQNTASLHASRRLVYISGSPGRVFRHRYLYCSQGIAQIRISGYGLRVRENSLQPFASSEDIQHCVEGALTPLRNVGIRVLFYLDDLLICALRQQQVERYEQAGITFGETEFQHKPNEQLSDSFTGNSLPGFQVKPSSFLCIFIRGAHRTFHSCIADFQ